MIFTKQTIPNFFKAIVRLIKHCLYGKKILADLDVVEKRRKICLGCEWYASQSEQCLICTCFINTKTNLHYESCPMKKW